MVLAYHLILTCYGFWLPNDPRGSWSDVVRVFELRPFGEATKTQARRSVAHHAHDHTARQLAKQALAHKPVRFTGRQALTVARSIGELRTTHALTIHALAVMPDHLHTIIARHPELTIEDITRRIKARATQQLNAQPPAFDHSPWAKGQWSVYLKDDQAIRRAIHYVDANPAKAGLKPQRWGFITPYPPPV